MSKNPENIELLVFKFNNGLISPEELETLTEWYNSHDDQNVIIATSRPESGEQVKLRMLEGLLTKVSGLPQKGIRLQPFLKWISAAAAILVLGLLIWKNQAEKQLPQNVLQHKSSIEPGGYKATLTLADGKTVPLSSLQTGIVAGEKITYADGAPVSNVNINQEGLAEGNMLALQTPRGGTYKITLPDGTEVWLNAASTIKYPSQFSPAERTVEIIGEAYFHVKTIYGENGKKVPFRVLAGQQEIEVLGTHFNVNSYPEQNNVKTTLEEGRVAIGDKKHRIALLPGQQAVTADGKTIVKKVNVTNYTAWRDGKFSFDDKTFEETMDEIARWYDLRIVYEKGIPDEEIVGDAFRNQNIHLVLRLLDAAEISYQLDVPNRKLTITSKK